MKCFYGPDPLQGPRGERHRENTLVLAQLGKPEGGTLAAHLRTRSRESGESLTGLAEGAEREGGRCKAGVVVRIGVRAPSEEGREILGLGGDIGGVYWGIGGRVVFFKIR